MCKVYFRTCQCTQVHTVEYLIIHTAGSQVGVCISRSYALPDVSHFVTLCDLTKSHIMMNIKAPSNQQLSLNSTMQIIHKHCNLSYLSVYIHRLLRRTPHISQCDLCLRGKLKMTQMTLQISGLSLQKQWINAMASEWVTHNFPNFSHTLRASLYERDRSSSSLSPLLTSSTSTISSAMAMISSSPPSKQYGNSPILCSWMRLSKSSSVGGVPIILFQIFSVSTACINPSLVAWRSFRGGGCRLTGASEHWSCSVSALSLLTVARAAPESPSAWKTASKAGFQSLKW